MKFYIETERLILRDILQDDLNELFELDSNPIVHKYLGNQPVKSINEIEVVINFIIEQYTLNGIGRWATIEKQSGEFIGWSGLKYVTDDVAPETNY
jgi:RimJ/RimL family protein N-acetyltransferase